MTASARLRSLGHSEAVEEASPGIGCGGVDRDGRSPGRNDDGYGEQLLAEPIDRARALGRALDPAEDRLPEVSHAVRGVHEPG